LDNTAGGLEKHFGLRPFLLPPFWQPAAGERGHAGAAGTAAPEELATERWRSVACKLLLVFVRKSAAFARGNFVWQRFVR
jgi:hypothetical protein